MGNTFATRRSFLQASGAFVVGPRGHRHASAPSERQNDDNNTDSEIAVVYIPFVGDKFGSCTRVSDPDVGRYGDPVPPSIVDEHVDQLTDAGASTVLFNFGEEEADYDRYDAYDRAERTSELSIEPFYVVSQALRRGRDIDRDLEFIRERFFDREHASRIEDRPVVTLWAVHYLAWRGNDEALAVNRRLEREYGSLTGFFEHLRESLTVDGTEPFIVGDVSDNVLGGGFPEAYDEVNRSLDGMTTWTGLLRPGETVSWPEAQEYTIRNFERLAEYAEERDLTFHPMVFPGFDDRHNSCWGGDRHVPRAPEHLSELLDSASDFSTDGRVNVATFNGWAEGHQIEAGTFRDDDYGTSYLDVIRDHVGGNQDAEEGR